MVARNFKTYDAVCSVGHLVREGLDVGEVRVSAVLRNGADAARRRAGELAAGEVREQAHEAVVDTGAVRLVIPRTVAESLGLPKFDTQPVRLADGGRRDLDVVGPVEIELEGRKMMADALTAGQEVLIGQTILEMTDLWVDCRNLRLVPNPNHPNGPASRLPRMKFADPDSDPPPV